MATQQMSVTMTGFAATHPVRHPSVARLVTFRMASTPRWNDNGEWRDGGTLFIDVQCWGKLGDHVMQSVVKGAPLVIAGRMTSYTYTPENGARTGQDGKPLKETIWRVTAGNVGLDLSHSPSSWSLRGRVKDTTADGEEPPAEAENLGGFRAVAESGGGEATGDAGEGARETAGDAAGGTGPEREYASVGDGSDQPF
ncbi:single-stranded DNA-binding protein [Corynebacterium nuruki]|jgi:single-strand DNA-binding protein|uniref:Single-stranded DNA-binding protein n=1 Tax=Corynebacterium nuruki TaxID=1032851 RepID=A0A3D4T192_9CORY|nr:single-stranded DNA-binding protein [Corynebacterium nuruki]HCT15316.1 single-stranded DNA-binding protein [Corynebacterium nuruki]